MDCMLINAMFCMLGDYSSYKVVKMNKHDIFYYGADSV